MERQWKPIAIKAENRIISVDHVLDIDVSTLEQGYVTVRTLEGSFTARDVDAIEAVMLIRPSALEGKRLRWAKNAWAVHNLIGHPGMQILSWFGLFNAAIRLHDNTIPKPIGFK